MSLSVEVSGSGGEEEEGGRGDMDSKGGEARMGSRGDVDERSMEHGEYYALQGAIEGNMPVDREEVRDFYKEQMRRERMRREIGERGSGRFRIVSPSNLKIFADLRSQHRKVHHIPFGTI